MGALRVLTAVVVSVVLGAGQFALAAEPCRVTRSELDGREQVVMENDYVSLTFTPSQGGRCTRFLYKPTGALWAGDAAGTHLLGDRIWEQQGGGGDWIGAPYKLAVLKHTPQEVSVELFGQGKTGALEFCGFRKRVTLTRDSSAVRVHYAYEVRQEAMAPQTAGLWFNSEVSLPKQKITCYRPVAEGVKTVLYDPLAPPPDYLDYEPTRGWLGLVGAGGSGLGVRMEYPRLMCLYQWFGDQVLTLEWMLRNVTIANNSQLETDVVFLPFHGLDKVSGLGDDGTDGQG